MAVTEYDVKCYEYILDYLETDDSTDEIEILSRIIIDKEWDSISPKLKNRILAIDKVELEKYADYFSSALWKEYLALIKARVDSEGLM